MIDHAVTASGSSLSGPVRRRLQSTWRSYFAEKRDLWQLVSRPQPRLGRWSYLLRCLIGGQKPAWDYLRWRLGNSSDWASEAVDLVRSWLGESEVSERLIRLQSENNAATSASPPWLERLRQP